MESGAFAEFPFMYPPTQPWSSAESLLLCADGLTQCGSSGSKQSVLNTSTDRGRRHPGRASPIRDRIALKRMFFYDPVSRFTWPGKMQCKRRPPSVGQFGEACLVRHRPLRPTLEMKQVADVLSATTGSEFLSRASHPRKISDLSEDVNAKPR